MSNDVFKKVYTPQTDEIKQIIFDMKSKAEELKAFFDKVQSREMDIALVNLENAVMWAAKAWFNEGDKLNSEKKAG